MGRPKACRSFANRSVISKQCWAVATDPDYPDARAFRAIVSNRQGDPDAARADLEALDTESLPAEVAPLIDQLRAEVEAATS